MHVGQMAELDRDQPQGIAMVVDSLDSADSGTVEPLLSAWNFVNCQLRVGSS